MADIKTEKYRVVGVHVHYMQFVDGWGPNGEETQVPNLAVGRFGDEIELTPREARKFEDLGVVVPADTPLQYHEQSESDLKKLAKDRGIDVRGSGANNAVVFEDLVNAHRNYDAAHTGGAFETRDNRGALPVEPPPALEAERKRAAGRSKS